MSEASPRCLSAETECGRATPLEAALAEANHTQALNEIGKHLAQIAGIDSAIAKQNAVLEATSAQIERAEQTLPLLKEKYDTLRGLYEKQYGPRPPVLDAEQALIEKQAELKAAKATSQQTRADIKALQANREEATAAFLVDAANQRTAALQKLATIAQEIAKDRQRASYRRLVAPVGGTVQNVKVHTPGAVVTAADTLMTIVPDDAGIEVDAQVENMDIGFVHEGQSVEIKLDAFPFTRYGLIGGAVRSLGRDSVTPVANPTPASADPTAATSPPAPASLTYPARISLAQTSILVDGVRQPLQPGMHVAAEIKTGTRRVLEYLLSPVMQAVKEAGRER